MWISKIELNNFKSYIHQVFTFPEPQGGKNIVLIGGLNGYGKTTLLEALYLCLYGADAIAHLGRAGLKPTERGKGYPTFLERALNGLALDSGRDNMSVKIQVNSSPNEGFEITRGWFFKKNGDWDQEEPLVQDMVGGILRPQTNQHLAELLDQRFVPAHLAPFFFFDGEEVKTLANRDRVEQIKMGMEGLLGVVLLRGLQKRLQQYQASCKSRSGGSIDEQKYHEIAESLARHEKQRAQLAERKEGIDRDIEATKAKRDDLMGRIMALGGGSGDIATASDIVRQQEAVKQQLAKCDEEMENILAGKLPFQLIAKQTLESFKRQLIEEDNLHRWNGRRASMEPDKEKFVSHFFWCGHSDTFAASDQ